MPRQKRKTERISIKARAVQSILVFAMLSILVFAVYSIFVARRPKFLIEYLDEFEASVEETSVNNAAPYYLEAISNLPETENEFDGFVTGTLTFMPPEIFDALGGPNAPKNLRDDLNEKWIKQFQKPGVLKNLRSAFQMEHCNFGFDPRDDPRMIMMKRLSEMRTLARMVAAYGKYLEHTGDQLAAAEFYCGDIRMGVHLCQQPTFYSNFTGFAALSIACRPLKCLLARGAGEETLDFIRDTMDAILERPFHMLGAVDEFETKVAFMEAELNAVRILTAACLEKARNGKYPKARREIMQYFPEGFPLDPFTGNLPEYRLEEGLPAVEFKINEQQKKWVRVGGCSNIFSLSDIRKREKESLKRWLKEIENGRGADDLR